MATCKECIHDKICFYQENTPNITLCPYFKTADVVEVKHGYWKLTKTELLWNGCEYPTEYTCTVCGGISPCCEEPYCPNCGAKMDGKGDT
jgi:hypothetical protein